MNTRPTLELEHVRFGYGRRLVLQDLDLAVPEGSTTVLLGTNGVGKSTLLRLALGVHAPRAGRVRVLGRDPARRRPAGVGYVPDRPDVWPWMRVGDLIRLVAAHDRAFSAPRAHALVEQLGVPRDRGFGVLSRGEGMKAMLATALAADPEVLLLDEPFGGLDALVREEVLRSVIGALGERPRTVLLATHDLDVAARVADRIAVLAHGRIVREGPAGAVAGPHTGSEATPEGLRLALAAAGEGI